MIAMEKADISLKMLLQVRGKLVSAYEEVMRMQSLIFWIGRLTYFITLSAFPMNLMQASRLAVLHKFLVLH